MENGIFGPAKALLGRIFIPIGVKSPRFRPKTRPKTWELPEMDSAPSKIGGDLVDTAGWPSVGSVGRQLGGTWPLAKFVRPATGTG